MYKKILLLISVISVIFIISCKENTENIVIPDNDYITIIDGSGESEYTIVRSDELNAYKEAALQFKKTADQLTGNSFKITTDWKSNPVTNKEIIIGPTTREGTYFNISRDEIEDEGFIITFADERLLIIGGNEVGTLNGVNFFFENHVGDDGSIVISKDYYYMQKTGKTNLLSNINTKTGGSPMIAVVAVKAREIIERRPIFDESPFWDLVVEAAEVPGCDLVLLPQYSVPKGKETKFVRTLSEAAEKYGVYIVYSIEVTENGVNYCESVILDRQGEEAGRYRQTHAVPGLDVGIGVGDDFPVFTLDFGKAAIMSGSDILFPEIAEIYSVKGAEILLYQAGVTPLKDDSELTRILKGRAVADYCFVAMSCYASEKDMYMTNNAEVYVVTSVPYGTDAGTHFNGMGLGFHTGRARILDLRGDILASTGRSPGVAFAKIPIRQKREIKKYIFGTGEIVYHQNKRGVFDELVSVTYDAPLPVDKRFVKIAMCHLPYSYTIQGVPNYNRIYEWMEKAAQTGADLVITSEYSATYEPGAEVFKKYAETAANYGCYMLANFGKTTGENISYLWDRKGELVFTYDKINNLCMMYDQREPAGDECPVFDTDFGRIGIMVCADTYSQEIARVYGIKGVDFILLQSQSWGYDSAAINEGVLCAYAIENCAYIVHNNFPHSQVDSRSLVIDPTGFIAVSSPYAQECIVEATLDINAVREKPCYVFGEKSVVRANDFKERVLSARRTSLYGLLTSEK